MRDHDINHSPSWNFFFPDNVFTLSLGLLCFFQKKYIFFYLRVLYCIKRGSVLVLSNAVFDLWRLWRSLTHP